MNHKEGKIFVSIFREQLDRIEQGKK